MNDLENLLNAIVRNLVDRPDEVVIKKIAGDKVTVFELAVGDGEIGKIIGKEGKTARSIRCIMNAVATKLKHRTVIEIIE